MIRLSQRQQQIIAIISQQEQASITQIKELLREDVSRATLNRELVKLLHNQVLYRIGKGRHGHSEIATYKKPINMDKVSIIFTRCIPMLKKV